MIFVRWPRSPTETQVMNERTNAGFSDHDDVIVMSLNSSQKNRRHLPRETRGQKRTHCALLAERLVGWFGLFKVFGSCGLSSMEGEPEGNEAFSYQLRSQECSCEYPWFSILSSVQPPLSIIL